MCDAVSEGQPKKNSVLWGQLRQLPLVKGGIRRPCYGQQRTWRCMSQPQGAFSPASSCSWLVADARCGGRNKKNLGEGPPVGRSPRSHFFSFPLPRFNLFIYICVHMQVSTYVYMPLETLWATWNGCWESNLEMLLPAEPLLKCQPRISKLWWLLWSRGVLSSLHSNAVSLIAQVGTSGLRIHVYRKEK